MSNRTVCIQGPRHPDLFNDLPTPTERHVDASELLEEIYDDAAQTLLGIPAQLPVRYESEV